MVYCVSYDLKKPDRNYDDLIKELKSFGIWWHQTGSVWIIVTSKPQQRYATILCNL